MISTIKHRRTKPRPGRLEGEALAALRLACYERDGGCCRECDTPVLFNAPHEWENSFHLAHIRNKRMWGDSLDNVRTLCGGCHRDSHQGTKNGKFQHGGQ